GAIERQVHTEVVVNHGVLVGSSLAWTGFADASRQSDGGLWAVDLSAAHATPRLLAGPVLDLKPFGPNVERGPVLASASGRTITSTIGGLKSVHLDVIDLATLSQRTASDGLIPVVVTDEELLVLRSGGLELRDLGSGKPRWSIRADLVYDVVADPAGEALVIAAAIGLDYV